MSSNAPRAAPMKPLAKSSSRHIARIGQRRATGFPDRTRRGFRLRRIEIIGQHTRSFRGQLARQAQSDASPGPGDKRNSSLKPAHGQAYALSFASAHR